MSNMMKHSWKCVLLVIVVSSNLFHAATTPSQGNETDLQALLDFKSHIIQDPFKTMSLWNDSNHHCNWVGITCNINKRVTNLNLAGRKLDGNLPPSIGNLTFLTVLSLPDNNLHGELPDEIGHLLFLQKVNLSYNFFGGNIPSNLSFCSQLKVISIVNNQLKGELPHQLSSLKKLESLRLVSNNLTGTIPAWIGNISSLIIVYLGVNNFHGSIPDEVGHLSSLNALGLHGNYLSGRIPRSIYNISSISYFTVAQNLLHGKLPADVGFTLPNLDTFAGGVNHFTGTVPESLLNVSSLRILDFAQNGLTGKLPKNIGSLNKLTWLNFDRNRLGTGRADDLNFFASLVNCTDLQILGLEGNGFRGEFPSSFANLSTQLTILTLGNNRIYGSIPNEIGKFVNLINLGLEGNFLSGSVPEVIGMLQNLQGLNLNGNNFSGPIPSSLGNLTRLTGLLMQDNNFEGKMPSSLGKCQNLLTLDVHNNKLNGNIPKQVIGLSSLALYLDMSHNDLTGSLPAEVGKLDDLGKLDLSENKLAGFIPSSLGSCISLEQLLLQGNLFEGSIPQTLENLRGLRYIDISRNNLSGKIPEFLEDFQLEHLNLSYNDFEGEVPKQGIFQNMTATSVYGNRKLCGGVQELSLPPCTTRKASRSRKFLAPKVLIPIISALLVLFLISCILVYYFIIKRTRKVASRAESSSRSVKFSSYSNLVKCTDGFSRERLIGSGSFGSVYKGINPDDGEIVAVKVINLQIIGASRSFTDECQALRSIRHRNLLKIITASSSVDHQGNEFKALVFEFMPHGNLDNWLHSVQHQSNRLTFIQRLNIAIDVASALEYLHHSCETPIVHCDIKPSNVLLDNDMVAHVSDFGLAEFLFDESSNSSKSSTLTKALKGSIGYIPPEYGMGGQPSVYGDIYSYGILLLEIFMGKGPTDEAFEGGMGISQFAEMALSNHVMDIIDPLLLISEEEFGDNGQEPHREENAIRRSYDVEVRAKGLMEDCLVSIMQIGVSCSAISPIERLPMTVVVNKLHAIKNLYSRRSMKTTYS